MSKQITAAELSAEVLGEMARLGYAESTLVLFRRAFRQLGEYAEEHDGGRFSEATAAAFLNDKFGTSMEDLYSHQPETAYLGRFLRCMRVLLEYGARGAIWRPHREARLRDAPGGREARSSRVRRQCIRYDESRHIAE